MTLLSALQELSAFPRDLTLARSSRECDPISELRQLDAAVVALNEKSASVRPPDPAKIERLVSRCKGAGYSLDGFDNREIRLLAWNNELLMNPQFREQLAERVRSNAVKPNILILSQVYFGNWGGHAQQELFEQMLRILAISQNGYTPVLQKYKEHATSIFSSAAHSFLSRLVVSERVPVLSLLEMWSVPATSPLATEAIRAYIEGALSAISKGELGVLDELLSTLELPLLRAGLFQKAAETMILCDQADRNESFRKRIEAFILDSPRLGDPRLPQNVPNWTGIDDAALRKFRTWRATKDLVFF